MYIHTQTWKRDSYNLYDYESDAHINKKQLKCQDSAKIVRNQDDIVLVNDFSKSLESS